MSRLQKCQDFKNVKTSKMSRLQKCQDFKNVKTSKMSRLQKCTERALVKCSPQATDFSSSFVPFLQKRGYGLALVQVQVQLGPLCCISYSLHAWYVIHNKYKFHSGLDLVQHTFPQRISSRCLLSNERVVFDEIVAVAFFTLAE